MSRLFQVLPGALLAGMIFGLAPASTNAQVYSVMPNETAPHEGTWLQWPHHYTYGKTFRNQIEGSWIAMTQVLVQSERVHIVAYNSAEASRIRKLLRANRIPLAMVDFVIRPTDDFWVRDNGPVFVYGLDGRLKITDWGFNGWGFDAPYRKDETVPIGIANARGIPRIDLYDIVLEGGAVEVDNGVLMATRSSILEPMRNPGVSQRELETLLTRFLGVSKFIWLDGADGGYEDITDTHIDGFARFGMSGTMITMSPSNLAYWGISNKDISTLYNATDISGRRYQKVLLPLTRNNVRTSYGYNTGNKGSYVNFYVANRHVLMPTYNDPNDAVAQRALQAAFPGRTVVGIDFRNVYRWGGMIHCVTQQQPVK